MTPEQIGYRIGVFLGGFVVGALCGVLPLKLGLKRERRRLALGSWISCVVAGLGLGLIGAVPVSIVFTVIILCLEKPDGPDRVSESSEMNW